MADPSSAPTSTHARAAKPASVSPFRREHQVLLESLLPRELIEDLRNESGSFGGPHIMQAGARPPIRTLRLPATCRRAGSISARPSRAPCYPSAAGACVKCPMPAAPMRRCGIIAPRGGGPQHAHSSALFSFLNTTTARPHVHCVARRCRCRTLGRSYLARMHAARPNAAEPQPQTPLPTCCSRCLATS